MRHKKGSGNRGFVIASETMIHSSKDSGRYTGNCKNSQNLNNAIKLLKIKIFMVLKSLSYVFLKVQQNKVALKFWFSQSNVDFFVLLYCSSKKPKNGGKHTFDKENWKFWGHSYITNFKSSLCKSALRIVIFFTKSALSAIFWGFLGEKYKSAKQSTFDWENQNFKDTLFSPTITNT